MRALFFAAAALAFAATPATSAALPGEDNPSGWAGPSETTAAGLPKGAWLDGTAVRYRQEAAAPAEGEEKRPEDSGGDRLATGDCGILNFALTLEELESAFYAENLARFGWRDFREAGVPDAWRVYRGLEHVAAHERRHVETLRAVTSSLCGASLPPCEYDFGVEDVHGFMALAGVLEKVGVSAYDGAVALIENGDIQTAAATIATIEARHASFVSAAAGLDPFPHDFETPLAGPAVITLASSVIKSCPFDIASKLGAAPFKSLKVARPADDVRSGSEVELEFEGSHLEGHFCSFLYTDKSVSVPHVPGCGCRVPEGAHGDIFVAVTKSDEVLTLKNTANLIVAGPIVVNVDTAEDEDCKDYSHGTTQEYSRHDDYWPAEEEDCKDCGHGTTQEYSRHDDYWSAEEEDCKDCSHGTTQEYSRHGDHWSP